MEHCPHEPFACTVLHRPCVFGTRNKIPAMIYVDSVSQYIEQYIATIVWDQTLWTPVVYIRGIAVGCHVEALLLGRVCVLVRVESVLDQWTMMTTWNARDILENRHICLNRIDGV